MTGFMKTASQARWWLEERAFEYQTHAASAYRAAHVVQDSLNKATAARYAQVREASIKDLVRIQHAAAYHAAIARECLLAALRLKGGQDQ